MSGFPPIRILRVLFGGAVDALKIYQNVALRTRVYFRQGIQDLSLNLRYSAETRKERMAERLAQSVAKMCLYRAIQVPAQPSDPSARQQPRVQAEQPGPGSRRRTYVVDFDGARLAA